MIPNVIDSYSTVYVCAKMKSEFISKKICWWNIHGIKTVQNRLLTSYLHPSATADINSYFSGYGPNDFSKKERKKMHSCLISM